MARFSFTIEGGGCNMCGTEDSDSRSSSPPELKYVKDKITGKIVSVQVCRECARKIEENERAEQAVKQHEQRQPIALTIAEEPARTPDVSTICESDPGSSKRTGPIKRRRRRKARKQSAKDSELTGSTSKLRAKRA